MADLHALANAISDQSANVKAFAVAVADVLQPVPPPIGVAPPLPPTTYSVPSGAVLCDTTAKLQTALTGSAPIVLADGEYDNPSYLANGRNLAIYAANPGKAVLRCGLMIGGNGAAGAPKVQGVTFGCHDPAKAFGGAALNIWGTAGSNVSILDTYWDGGGTLPFGIYCLNPNGLTLARAKQTTPYGQVTWRLSDNNPSSSATITAVADVDGAGALQSLNGTAGVVLWLGHPVGTCARLRLGSGATASLETVNRFVGVNVTDVELFGSPVAHYCEHFTRGSTFVRGLIRDCAIGVNGEWDDDVAGNAATHNCRWDQFTIRTSKAGAYFDKGSESNAVTNTLFVGQSWAAVGAYLNTGTNDFATGNTYQLPSGAVRLSTAHI